MELQVKPILRMYELTIDQKNRDSFVKEGTHNLLTSHANESGTLAMYATHLDQAGTKNFVFELYQNLEQYQIHANSPQFKQYGQLAQKVLTGHTMQELQPQFLTTNSTDLAISGENDYVIRMTKLTLPETKVKTFKEDLKKLNLSAAAVYAATIGENDLNWIILEVTRPNELSAALSELIKSESEISTEQLLKVDTMVSQANLKFSNI